MNSLDPGRFKLNFGWVIFKLTLVTDGWVISCEISLSWMSLNLTDDKSILVLVMAWCHQASSHYLNQCWPRSMLPYGVTGPQWVKEQHFDGGGWKITMLHDKFLDEIAKMLLMLKIWFNLSFIQFSFIISLILDSFNISFILCYCFFPGLS